MVGFSPGGPSDIISRVVGAKMGEILGVQAVIENKAGAGGMIAAEAAARSEPDGYTLLNTPLAYAVNETLSKSIKVLLGKDLIAVGPQAETANILVVHPSLGVKSLKEFIALIKSKPNEILYATAGRGSATHLNSEFFNIEAGVKMNPVHYKGGADTVKDLLTGQVKVMFSSIAPVQELVKDGRLIGLATTGPKRDPAFPDLPTVAETIPGFDVRLWMGLTAPAGTPPAIVKRLEDANRKAVESPDDPEGARRPGLRAARRHRRGVRRLLPQGARQVGQGHHGVRHGQGVARTARREGDSVAGPHRIDA